MKKSFDKARFPTIIDTPTPIPPMKPLIAAVAMAMAVIGKPAPDFTASNVKGESVSLADFKGKVVVLEWVNYECPFVKKHYQSGNLPKLQETYTAKGVVWLSVSSAAAGKQGYLEPAKMAERATKEGNKASHFLMDTDGKIGKAYGAKVTPHMFIINKDGVLAYDGAMDSKATPDIKDIETADKLFVNALDAVLEGKEVANAKNQPVRLRREILSPWNPAVSPAIPQVPDKTARVNCGMNSERVVIVGGGVIGLCSAYYALKRGFAVTVIEREPPAATIARWATRA